MKKTFTLLILIVNFFISNAQTNIDLCTNYCQYDLRSSIGLTINTDINVTNIPVISYAKRNSSSIYNDVRYKLNNQCYDSIPNTTCDDIEKIYVNDNPNDNIPDDYTIATALKFKVYYPTNVNYSTCKIPALILFHAGAYSECSDLDNGGIVELCKNFAHKGFCVFSVEYRRGVLPEYQKGPNVRSVPNGVPFGIGYTTAQQILAIYRACQDGYGAIKSIIKFENDGWPNYEYGHNSWPQNYPWHIDKNKIFVGGISAGAVIALNVSYYQDQTNQWDKIFQGGVSTSLGNINNNAFYYAGSETAFPTILAVVDCWGTLMIPTDKLSTPYDFFSSNTRNPPIICFHGEQDATFNYDYQGVYFSSKHPNPQIGDLFRTESNCISPPYTVPPVNSTNDNNVDAWSLGSQRIYSMFKNAGIYTELYLDCTMAHGLDDCTNNPETCPYGYFDSNFGLALPTTDVAIYEYMSERAATFFQAILKFYPNPVSNNYLNGRSRFVECENYRNKCAPANNNAGCCDTDDCNQHCGNYYQ